jgi:hypothetical protein
MRGTGGQAGRWAVATSAIVAGLFGCGATARDREEGRLEASWTGAEKGGMSGKATAIWCRRAGIAQLTAVQGDTGIGLLIHPTDSLVAGQYPIVEAASARAKAPAATLGLRLMTQIAVVGYQARGGRLTLERVRGARISGRFDAKANVVTAEAGAITVNGRFLDVPLAPGGRACPP